MARLTEAGCPLKFNGIPPFIAVFMDKRCDKPMFEPSIEYR
jgi:hypothetical protein